MYKKPQKGGKNMGKRITVALDAMGGEMGRAIDDTFLQSRMLNMSKGPAVHALRAQADKQQQKAFAHGFLLPVFLWGVR